MSSISAFRFVCFMFFVAWINEVGAGKIVFDVTKYGAVADGKTDNSKVFQNVFDKACQSEGYSSVLIPDGKYMLGPVLFAGPCKGPIELVINGALISDTDVGSYGNKLFHWITFYRIDRLAVVGGGSLDGRGPSAWPHNTCSKSKSCNPLPSSMGFNFVNNSRVTHLSSINSMGVHMNLYRCSGMKFDNIHLIAPEDSPNTDGIHIGESTNIDISSSVIATGDDCVSLSPGCSSINVTDVWCGPGHGISVGSLGRMANEEDVSGLTVTNCTFTGTQNGLRVKTWASSFASNAFDLTFQNIRMENVYNPIVIDQQYCPYDNCQKGNSQVQIQNVKYRNIWGTSRSKIAVALECSQSKPCQKIELSNIELVYSGAGGPASSSCNNANGAAYGPQKPPSCI
ncbi:hypothetical protein FH972_020247 [Carpinus fangiana]|uniref:Pectate lyase superfamily protein domain-containing protein n=1 Tax=Carpinus fangiana TaxID=176857 RepID=A0A5N6RVT5_9ROSI|nr:hypothetical protein FH972_020247 [Carpinus fangiana]